MNAIKPIYSVATLKDLNSFSEESPTELPTANPDPGIPSAPAIAPNIPPDGCHTLTLDSSILNVATIFPSSENATAVTALVCPFRLVEQ